MAEDSSNNGIVRVGNNSIARYSNTLIRRAIDELSYKKHLDDEAILIVDDEPTFLYILSAELKEKGFNSIDKAENGQIAIEKLQSRKYRLVLLGLKMPVLDGFGVLSFIKENLLSTKAVVISGFATDASISRAWELGAYDFFTKPYDVDQLILTVTKIMKE